MAKELLPLTENEVIEFVAQAFFERGYAVVAKHSTSQRGVDLHVADKSGRAWRIEAKGGTSAATGSRRFGKPFTAAQISVHVAKAMHQALCLRAKFSNSGIAVALPDDSHHRKEILAVGDAFERLGIHAIWVSANGLVQLPDQL